MQLTSMQHPLDSHVQNRLPAERIQRDHGLLKMMCRFSMAGYLLAMMLYLGLGHALAEEAPVTMPAPDAPLSATPAASSTPASSTPAPMAAEAAGPKLEMRMPAPHAASGKRPRSVSKRDEDARACLDQTTVAKIRACAEKYR